MRKFSLFLTLLLCLLCTVSWAQTSPLSRPAFGGVEWTWDASINKFTAEGKEATATPGRSSNPNYGPVLVFNHVGTSSSYVTGNAGNHTSDNGGIRVLGESYVKSNLYSWAGAVEVEQYAIAEVSYGVQLKGTEPDGHATVWVDGTLTFPNRTNFDMGDGNDQRWFIGEHGIIITSFNQVSKKSNQSWHIQIVVNGEGEKDASGNITRKVMTWSADLHDNIASCTVLYKTIDGRYVQLDDDVIIYDNTGITIKYKPLEQPLSWSKPIVDGATYAIVNVQPSNSATRYYYLNNSNGTLTPVDATDKNTLSEWPTTAQFVAKDLGNGKLAFRNKSNGLYLAYKAFSATVEDWSSWTMHESSRTGFENTYWFGCAKRASNNNSTGTLIIANGGNNTNAGTFDNCEAVEYSATTYYSNNYGFVLLKEPSDEPAGTVIANMQTLVADATENNATAATNYETDVEGGAIYSFANNKFIKSITNTGLVNAYAGDKVITIAMWVYGSPTGCPFGYGDGGTGIKYRFVDDANWQITTKSVSDFTQKSNANLLADRWNLVAFAVPAKANTAVRESRYYSGAEDANGFTSVSNTTSGMNIPEESGQKFAIGSGDQGSAREAFTGTLANLTVIESDGMLLNSEIAALLGKAPRISPRSIAISEYRDWKATLYDGETLKIGAPSEIALASVEDVIDNPDNDADAIRAAFNTVKTTNRLNLPTGYYYFRSVATDNNRNQPYLYNHYFLTNNTQHHTLQSESKPGTNAAIWYVTNNGDHITIKNGDGQPLVQGNEGQGNNGTVSARETLTFGAFNATNFANFSNQGIYFTEALNAAANTGTYSVNNNKETLFVTTWTGHADARDNHWTFEPIETPSNIYNVVIEGAPDGQAYVTMTGGQYAFNGGFLYGAEIAEGQLTVTDITGYNHSIDIKDKTITVLYFDDSKSVVTYVYKNGETEWLREKHLVENGADYPDLRTLPNGVKISTVPNGKVTANATIGIECTVDDKYDIPFSASYGEAKWLYATIRCDSKYFWSYDSSTKRVKTTETDFSKAQNKDAYMWAIIGNPIAGYQIINKAAGADMILTSASPNNDGASGGNTFPVMTNKDEVPGNHNTRWNINTYDYGYSISREGENFNFNRRGNNLAYWTGKDQGSRVGFFPIEETIVVQNPMEGGKTYQARNLMSGEIITDFTDMTISTGNVDGCYHLSSAASVTTTPAIFYASQSISATENPVQWSSLSAFSEWIIEEKTENLFDFGEPTYESTITDGKYYRLYCIGRDNKFMTDQYSSTKGVTGNTALADVETGTQIWKLVKTGDTSGAVGNFTLQNVLTGRYIGDQGNTSNIFPVVENSSSAKQFVVQTGTADDGTVYFTFSRAFNGHGLHLDAGGNVVKWEMAAGANRWAIDEVVLSQEQLDAYAAFYNDYKTKLNSVTHAEWYQNPLDVVFEDKACTRFTSAYASKTAEEIRSELAGAGVPEILQDMAVCVKNDKWDENAAKNRYVKDFRIHSYDIYSDPDKWNAITKVGRFSNLYHPTGIACKAGELIYVMVSDNPKDDDAKLELGITPGTNNNPSQTVTLHAGLNIIMPATDGEAFVIYRLINTDKYLKDYPNITVHIEGGEATGCFDMHRGHTNNDWAYLCSNMFTNKYLHLMAENTAFCVESDRVRGAENITGSLKIWDYIFMTEEKLIGHDGQWDGKYNPVIVARDQYSGNPNWGGTSANYSGIFKDGLLNYNSLLYGDRWVIYHEEAHGHQYPVNMAATTESSNNGFAQMVNHEFGLSSRRGNGTKTLLTFKNNGWGWVDILRGGEGISRTNSFEYYGDCVWLQNHLFYQLYLYFHVAGKMPNFWPRLCDEMRSNGGLIKKSSPTDPTLYYDDYLKFALAAAKVSKTDLSEFFDSYGFFDYYEDVKVGNEFAGFKDKEKDYASTGVRYVGDYGGYYMKMPMKSNQADVDRINAAIAEMKAYTNKAPNIMFIDDHIKDRVVADTAFAVTLDPSLLGQPVNFYDNSTGIQGDFGDMTDFNGQNEANNLDYSISGNTVTMTGTGLVGVKIYDAEGNLKYIYNTTTFTLADGVAAKLTDGTYTLVAALGNDTNLPLAKPGATKYEMAVYNGTADDTQTYKVSGTTVNADIPYSATNTGTDVPKLEGNAVALYRDINSYFTLPVSLRGNNVFTNTKAGTSEAPQWNAMTMQFTDKADFYLPNEGTFSAGVVNYPRINTEGLNSVCLPFAINTTSSGLPAGSKIYALKEIGETTISFVETNEVAAGEFCIIDCPNDTKWDLGGAEITLIGTPIENNSQGSFQNKTIGAGYYKLNGAGTKFGVTTVKGSVTAFRGYIQANGMQSSSFDLVLEENDDLTSVESAATTTDGPTKFVVYDLNGNKVATLIAKPKNTEELKLQGLQSGTYIINHEKVYIP